MIIIDISFWEFTALIDACVSTSLKGNPKQIVFLLDARWQRRSASHQQLVYETLNKAEEIGYQEIYRLFSNGNDEVEDYLLNNLQKRSFPALITENFPIVTENDSRSLSFSSLSRQFARCPVGERLGTLFVSGDRSSVGKSTSCLALLACLIKAGISPDDIGYIKPVTQCEEQQPVVEYCNHVGIECRGIGPVVFYKGFTRAFLNDETEENSQELLLKAINAVRDIESRRKFVLVDGVGYPSVGSICGLSNAQVAGSLNVPVLLIGRSGVGDAVDAHNLNSVYFQYHGCRVLGSIFNKLSLTGFYSLQACKDAVNLYFDKYGMGQRAYGYVPQLEKNDTDQLTATFMKYVDVAALIASVFLHHLSIRSEPTVHRLMYQKQDEEQEEVSVPVQMPKRNSNSLSQSSYIHDSAASFSLSSSLSKKPRTHISNNHPNNFPQLASISTSVTATASPIKKRSREEIVQAAKQQGAKGG